MKALFLIFSLITFSFSDQYVFLIDKYNEEVELEAKIVAKIASASLDKKRVSLYIPKITKEEKRIYSRYFKLSKECSNVDFIFDKGKVNNLECKKDKALYFTNNYKKLVSNKKYFGAFFWNKGRPNIVFVKNRLNLNQIKLPKTYKRYIENFNE